MQLFMRVYLLIEQNSIVRLVLEFSYATLYVCVYLLIEQNSIVRLVLEFSYATLYTSVSSYRTE